MKIPHTTRLLGILILLLCSVTIAPAYAAEMSHTAFIEDGVHLLKDPGYPSQLDRDYYKIRATDTITVAGTQYYWVQIGDDTTQSFTNVWWGYPLGFALSTIITLIMLLCGYYILQWIVPVWSQKPLGKTTTGHFVLLSLGLLLILHLTPIMEKQVNQHACQDFIKLQDADGCILLKVNKTTATTDPLILKAHITLSSLTHIDGTLPLPQQSSKGARPS